MKWQVFFTLIWGHDGASWMAPISITVVADNRVEGLRIATAVLDSLGKFEIGNVIIAVAQ